MTFPADSTALALFGLFLSFPHHTLSFGFGTMQHLLLTLCADLKANVILILHTPLIDTMAGNDPV